METKPEDEWLGFVPGVPILIDECGRIVQRVNDEIRELLPETFRLILKFQIEGKDDEEILHLLTTRRTRR